MSAASLPLDVAQKKAAGWLVLGLIGVGVAWWLIRRAGGAAKAIGQGTGLIAAPETGSKTVIPDELGPLEVAGRIVQPTSGQTVRLDDWLTPQYRAAVRLLGNHAGTVTYKLQVTEDPPLGDGRTTTLGPFIQPIGMSPVVIEHMVPRLSSLLQGTPLATMSLIVGTTPEHAVTYEVGT